MHSFCVYSVFSQFSFNFLFFPPLITASNFILVGRIAGQDGKTRFAIENATRTRIVVADTRIHLLGSYANIRVARNAICDLILGAPPGKVYNNMRNVAKRMNERY
jgi:RNA-binding protein PNO1